MAEETTKRIKTAVSRNTDSMTVTIGKVTYTLTTKTAATINALALAGFADNLIDCVSTMTLKQGFTEADRNTKRAEKAAEINADVLRSGRVAVINVEKAIEKVSKMAETSDKLAAKEKAELTKLLAKMSAK